MGWGNPFKAVQKAVDKMVQAVPGSKAAINQSVTNIPGSRESAIKAARAAALAAAAYGTGGLAAGIQGTALGTGLGYLSTGLGLAAGKNALDLGSQMTGGSGDIMRDVGKGLGLGGGGGDAPAAAPAAAAMPLMDEEAIARSRRMAALKGAGGGRTGTFLGGAGLGNG